MKPVIVLCLAFLCLSMVLSAPAPAPAPILATAIGVNAAGTVATLGKKYALKKYDRFVFALNVSE